MDHWQFVGDGLSIWRDSSKYSLVNNLSNRPTCLRFALIAFRNFFDFFRRQKIESNCHRESASLVTEENAFTSVSYSYSYLLFIVNDREREKRSSSHRAPSRWIGTINETKMFDLNYFVRLTEKTNEIGLSLILNLLGPAAIESNPRNKGMGRFQLSSSNSIGVLPLITLSTLSVVEDLTRVKTGLPCTLSGDRLEITENRIHTLDR